MELGGEEYLHSLRDMKDASVAQEKLIEFKGVGLQGSRAATGLSSRCDQIEAIPGRYARPMAYCLSRVSGPLPVYVHEAQTRTTDQA